ncbi:MAG: tetraacyldisaccharide 4'-kinase [Gammaproteobacteria bacterium]
MRVWLAKLLQHIWYRRSLIGLLLVPVSWIYAAMLALHRARAASRRESLMVPVVVVGNVTVGGTGKTPVVIWLVEQLRGLGYRPGIVTRGYGGNVTGKPFSVDPETSASVAGDEAVLLARRLHCPVVACADRVAAARMLSETANVDVIVSDDGLQHFALPADCEIVVVDGARGMGNGRLLPAGPLRERPRRLEHADVVLVNGPGWTHPGALRFDLPCTAVVQLRDGLRRPLSEFSGSTVHALAAIGNPDRFFEMLRQAGCTVDEHAWPDHAVIPIANLAFADAAPVLITEKDAVKLPQSVPGGVWSVVVDVELSSAAAAEMLGKIAKRIGRDTTSQ